VVFVKGKKVTVYAKTQKECQAKIRDIRAEGVPSKLTVKDGFEAWISFKIAQDRQDSTIRAYRQSMAPALATFGHVPLAKITTDHVENLCLELGNTRRSQMTREVLRNFLRHFEARDIVKGNAAEKSQAVKVKKTPKPRISWDELKGIAEYADNLTLQLFVATLADTGMRPYKECAGLKKKDLKEDDHGWWIAVPDSKTETGIRDIPIDGRLFDALQGLAPDSEWLFPTEKDTRFHWRNMLKAWHRWQIKWIMGEGKNPNRPLYDLYSLRHLYCSSMAQAGVRDKVLQRLMGHKDIRTTNQYYNHADAAEVQKAISSGMSELYQDHIKENEKR
jgi:integrase